MSLSIVIIDDDEDEMELLENAFKDSGLAAAIMHSVSYKELLIILDKILEAPDVIICDYNMPLINGIEVRKGLVEKNFGTIPFILLTGTGPSQAMVQQAKATKVKAVLLKPATITGYNQLINTLRYLLHAPEQPSMFLIDKYMQ